MHPPPPPGEIAEIYHLVTLQSEHRDLTQDDETLLAHAHTFATDCQLKLNEVK